MRDEALKNQVKTDPHSPGMYRAYVPLLNLDTFYSAFDIKQGDKFTKKNIRIIRPGFGVQPFYFEKLLNKKSPFNITAERPINKKVIRELKIIWKIFPMEDNI